MWDSLIAREWATAALAAWILLGVQAKGPRPADDGGRRLEIPAGRAIQVDGILASHEWDDAATVEIPVNPDSTIRVLCKHDTSSLYVAFVNLHQRDQRLFPEVLVNSRDLKESSWGSGQWWLHASHNLCEGNGAFNVYQRNGVFQCSHTKEGWTANNPPSQDGGEVEFQISFSKLQLEPRHGTTFGIAFDVTDATGNKMQLWRFWPANARLETPSTWGVASLK